MANLNKMARTITLNEGLKQSLSIAQVKEVMRLTIIELNKLTVAELWQVLSKVR